MDFLSILKDKRRLRGVLIVSFLLVAIPLTIYLVYQQQIFKSKALGEGSTLAVIGSQGGFVNSSPPSTTSPVVNLLLTWNPGAAQPTPSPTHTPSPTTSAPTATTAPNQPSPTPGTPGVPTPGVCPGETNVQCGSGLNCVPAACGVSCSGSTPSLCYLGNYRLCCSVPVPTLTAISKSGYVDSYSITLGYGSTFTVSWTGVKPANATDLYWIIRDDKNLGTETYLGTCSKTPPSSISSIPESGSCIITPPPVENYYTYKLYHFVPPSSVTTVATSNQVTVLKSPF